MAVAEIAAHLCLTLIIEELRISVEHGRVVTTLNIIQHQISFLIYEGRRSSKRMPLIGWLLVRLN